MRPRSSSNYTVREKSPFLLRNITAAKNDPLGTEEKAPPGLGRRDGAGKQL